MTKSDLILYQNRVSKMLRESNLSKEDKDYIENFIRDLCHSFDSIWNNLITLTNIEIKEENEENLMKKMLNELGNCLLYKLSLGERGNLDLIKDKKVDKMEFDEDDYYTDYGDLGEF